MELLAIVCHQSKRGRKNLQHFIAFPFSLSLEEQQASLEKAVTKCSSEQHNKMPILMPFYEEFKAERLGLRKIIADEFAPQKFKSVFPHCNLDILSFIVIESIPSLLPNTIAYHTEETVSGFIKQSNAGSFTALNSLFFDVFSEQMTIGVLKKNKTTMSVLLGEIKLIPVFSAEDNTLDAYIESDYASQLKVSELNEAQEIIAKVTDKFKYRYWQTRNSLSAQTSFIKKIYGIIE